MTPRSWFSRSLLTVFAIFAVSVLSPTITSASDLVFGPVTCQRGTGAPTVFEYSFPATTPSQGYIFQIYNGGLEDTTYELVSSSIIKLNGTEIIGPSNFSQSVTYLEVPVTLQAQNTLNVEVRGKPGGAIIIKLFPFVVLDVPAQSHIFQSQPITVSGRLYSSATSVSVNGFMATVSGTSFSLTGVPLVEGRNTIAVMATRAGGFVGSDSAEVVLDSLAPVIGITYPSEGLVTNQNVEPRFTISDAQDPNPTMTIAPVPQFVTEGTHQMIITSTDWAGNQAQVSRSFTIDKTSPIVGSAAPAPGFYMTEGMPLISAAWSDVLSGLDLATARLVLDGNEVTGAAQVTSALIRYQPSVKLSEGLHQVFLTVKDIAGNEASLNWSFSIDTTPPQINISSPFEGSATNQNVSLAYTVQDNADQNPTVTVTPPPPFNAEGAYHVVITATDQAGNQAQATRDFVIDRTAPTVVFVFPAEGLLTNQDVVPVYTATDALDPQPTVVLTPAPPYATEGSYQVTLSATDRAGNSTEEVRHFNIDKTPPSITVLSPQDGTTVSVSSVDVVGTVDDPTAIVTINGTATALSGMNFTVPGIALALGANQLLIEARDAVGNTSSFTLHVTYVPPAPTVTLKAIPSTIILGESVTLSWTSTDVTGIMIDQGIGTVAASGSHTIEPSATTTFTITASGPGGTTIAEATVTVTYPAPSVILSASPGTILEGSNSTLSWTATDASTCSIEPGVGVVTASGSSNVSPAATTVYSISCSGSGGSATASTTVIVDYQPPTASLSAVPSSVLQGTMSTLSWNSSHAQVCALDNGIGSVPCSGTQAVTPSTTTTYILTATGAGGSVTTSATVAVMYPLPTVSLRILPESILQGASSTLSWTSTNATSCSIDQGVGTVSVSGSRNVTPNAPTTYTVIAFGPSGTATATATVTVASSAPTASLSAAPSVIDFGSFATLTWSSTNATTCSIDNGIGVVACSGSVSVSPMAMSTYTFRAVGLGGTASSQATIYVNDPWIPLELTATITATPSVISMGDIAELGWDAPLGISCYLCDESGCWDVPCSGSNYVSPEVTTTYLFNATDFIQEVNATATVTVVGSNQPIADIIAAPSSLTSGEVSVLTWSTANASTCSINNGVGSVPCNGSTSVMPALTTTYVLTATGLGGTTTAQTTVVVTQSTGSVNLSASPSTIHLGETTTLSWSAAGVTGIVIDQGVGNVQPIGSVVVQPTSTTEYAITASGALGVSHASVLVTVLGNVAQQPEGSFGEKYQDLIPQDATVAAYDAKRFSLVTGKVLDRNGQPIAGVRISIQSNPGYGSAATDEAGMFSIPVEGGGHLTVSYKKSGYLVTHRKVDVPWNDIAIVDAVTMIPADSPVTRITFDGNASTVSVHQSSIVTDEFGSRSAAMVFVGDTMAYAKVDNNEIQLSTVDVRATEFETQDSMPAKLPPNSAYTYCVDFAVDGADQVRFTKPVITYVDNFLNFPVGMVVPAGYYDTAKVVWVPSDNGVVVQLLDADGDGVIDSLDASGDGIPDDLNGDGHLDDEVRGTNGNDRFAIGSTYWRVGVTHFTPWDYNWPYGPVTGAIAPNAKADAVVDQQKSEEQKDPISCTASYVEHSSRVLHEDVPIPGTDLGLHYASNRVPGYKTLITVPASGDSVPDVLKRIIVRLRIAGVEFEQTVEAGPNKNVQFAWDGRDVFGRAMSGSIVGETSVGFVYNAVYNTPSSFARAFASLGTSVTTISARTEIVSWKAGSVVVKIPMSQGNIANGWTLSDYDQLDTTDHATLYRGDGSYSNVQAQGLVTIAGSYTPSTPIYGIPATEASLSLIMDVVYDPGGNLFLGADFQASMGSSGGIYKIDQDGIISLHAASSGYCGSTGSAPLPPTCLGRIYSVVVDDQGNLYASDADHNRILKIDTNRVITVFAGSSSRTSSAGNSGDNGPAVDAKLYRPEGIVLDKWGNLYIADTGNHRIRKVDANGTITAVAGTGPSGTSGGAAYPFNGDGILAANANLNSPRDLACDDEGNLYLSDIGAYRIRKIDVAGIISTIAGTGQYGYSGDGVAAAQANIVPKRIALDTNGDIYFLDSYRIRKVDARGVISTVAGTGAYGFTPDGALPLLAKIIPSALVFDKKGRIAFADYYTHVRRVDGISANATGHVDANGKLYHFQENGLPQSVSDGVTGAGLLQYTYDSCGKLSQVVDLRGNTLQIARNSVGLPIGIDVNGVRRADLSVGEGGSLQRVSFPDNTLYEFEYSASGLMLEKHDQNGNVFRHVFDEYGRIESADDPEGGQWLFSSSVNNDGSTMAEVQSAEGDLINHRQNVSSLGAKTIVSRDIAGSTSTSTMAKDEMSRSEALACGTAVEVTFGLDPQYQTRFEQGKTIRLSSGVAHIKSSARIYEDSNGDDIPDVVTYQDSINGKTWTMENDVLRGIITTTSPTGRQSMHSYDTDKLLETQSSVPGLLPATYSYDQLGRPASISVGNRTSTLAYDMFGNVDYVVTSDNRLHDYTFDIMGRLHSVARPDGSMVEYQYDANGNLSILTNPNSISFGLGYTANNQRQNITHPLSGAYQYSYDRDRRLKSITAPSGEMIMNTYAEGNLRTTTTTEGITSYDYLCGSRLGSVTYKGETITFGYDGPLVTSDTRSGTLAKSIGYTYNNDFSVTSMSYAGTTISFGYDNDGLLTSTGGFTIFRNIQNGLPEGVTGQSFTQARTFNGYAELDGSTSNVSGAQIYAWSVPSRDNAGRILRRQEILEGSTVAWEYSYNAVGRLMEVKKDGLVVESYTYDGNGNRTTEINTMRGISGRSFGYTIEDHVLTAGSDSYQFDVDGFLQSKTTADGATYYQYSSRGELLRVDLPDGTIFSYVHDPLGRPIAKQVNGTTVEKYLWAGQTTLLAVYDGSDNLLQRYTYADARMPVSMTAGGSTYFLLTDQVGTLRAVADTSGAIVKKIDYDSFGNIIADSNPSFSVPFGFAGGLHDRDTGLVRFGFRDYSPELGRFVAKDPLDFAGGDTNLYAYAMSDPINLTDPLGLAWQLSLGVSGTIGGGTWLPALFGGGGTSIGITSQGQLFIQFQANGEIGGGIYGGIGFVGAVSHSDCPLKVGGSTSGSYYVEANLGSGPSLGYSASYGDDKSIALSRSLKGGLGYGFMAAGGRSTTTTFATPALW